MTFVVAAFLIGAVVGALLARSRVIVKFGNVEIQGASAREVGALLHHMHEHAERSKQVRV